MQQLVILLVINCYSTCFGHLYAQNMLSNNLLLIKSLIVASSWSHFYLLTILALCSLYIEINECTTYSTAAE